MMRTSLKYDLNHLGMFETFVHGPIQDDEALFLFSLCKMIRPKTIVEFGMFTGMSTWNFAKAKDDSCFLYGFDLNENAVKRATDRCCGIKNCFFKWLDYTKFSKDHIDKRNIDLVFLDCSHDFEKNKICLNSFLPLMTDNAILAIHDTGFYHRDIIKSLPSSHRKKYPRFAQRFASGELSPVVKDEQLTVDWIKTSFPEWSHINLFSIDHFRHGITILQKSTLFHAI